MMALDRKLVLALTLALGLSRAARTQEPSEPPPTFEGLLKQIASVPADACPYPGTDFSDLEYQLFSQADNAVVQELNETSNSQASEVPTAAKIEIPGSSNTAQGRPQELARKALAKLEHLSAELNESWPEEKRFHFVVLNLPPALVV